MKGEVILYADQMTGSLKKAIMKQSDDAHCRLLIIRSTKSHQKVSSKKFMISVPCLARRKNDLSKIF